MIRCIADLARMPIRMINFLSVTFLCFCIYIVGDCASDWTEEYMFCASLQICGNDDGLVVW